MTRNNFSQGKREQHFATTKHGTSEGDSKSVNDQIKKNETGFNKDKQEKI